MKIRLRLPLLLMILIIQNQACSQKPNQLVENLKTLSSKEMDGRLPGTEGHKKAQNFIIDAYRKMNVKPYGDDYLQEFELLLNEKKMTGINVLSKIPGKSSSQIVISAHYDHLGTVDGKTFFGTDDNASGVAAMIYIAEYFSKKKPNNTIVFAAFDGEERGLQGSKYFVSTLEENQVKMNINMDMVSRSDAREIYACGTAHYPEFIPLLNQSNQKVSGVSLKLGHDVDVENIQNWTLSSDHAPFHLEKIPFIYFGVEDHGDYHKATDTFDKVDPDFYQEVVKMILDFVIRADQQLKDDNE